MSSGYRIDFDKRGLGKVFFGAETLPIIEGRLYVDVYCLKVPAKLTHQVTGLGDREWKAEVCLLFRQR